MINKGTIKDVLDISLPVVGEAVVYTLMSMLDIMMIGNYGGNKAVSIVGLSNEILYTSVDIFIGVGLCVGIASYVSRSVGARDSSSAEEYASIGFFTGIWLSLIVCYFLFVFSKQILSLGGARGDILILGEVFMKITSVAIFFNMMINIVSSILRSYGNTYTPFKVALLVTVVKLALSYLLIFGVGVPELGVVGAAISSVVSQLMGFLYITVYLIFKSKIKVRLKHILVMKMDKVKKLFMLSIPSTMEDAAFSISRLLCTFIIMRAGTVAFAANQIANTVESISVVPGISFGVAATTLVGMKIGERNYKKAKEYTYACVLVSVAMMCVFAVIFLLMPSFLVDLFIGDEEKKVIKVAALCLFIGAFEQPSIAMSSVFAGALKGAGDTKSPFFISLGTSWLIRLPLTFYFIYILKLSITYLWWVTVLQWGIDAILMFLYFEKKIRMKNFVN